MNRTNRSDRPEAAEGDYQAALALCDSVATAHPDVPEYQESLADTLNNLARLYEETRRVPQAEQPLLRALAIRKKLIALHPESPGFPTETRPTPPPAGLYGPAVRR